MRIVSFRRDGQVSYGMLDGDSVVDLPALDHRLPPVLRDALPVLGGGYVPPAGARQAVSLSEAEDTPVIAGYVGEGAADKHGFRRRVGGRA